MFKWFRAQTPTVKGMLILCILLVIGIIIRWEYVSREVGESFRERFKTEKTTPPAIPASDSTSISVRATAPLRDSLPERAEE